MVSLHWAAGAIGVVDVMTKNLFSGFLLRITFVLAACAGLTVLCLGPFLFLAVGATLLPALLAVLAIAALYTLSSRHSNIAPWFTLLFPAGAMLFLYSLLRSAFITLRAGGVIWRGTFYPLAELRKGKARVR